MWRWCTTLEKSIWIWWEILPREKKINVWKYIHIYESFKMHTKTYAYMKIEWILFFQWTLTILYMIWNNSSLSGQNKPLLWIFVYIGFALFQLKCKNNLVTLETHYCFIAIWWFPTGYYASLRKCYLRECPLRTLNKYLQASYI